MTTDEIAKVLIALAAVVGAAHLVGHAFERLRQPRLIGEIVAGILLGPFVLGRVAPHASQAIFGTGTSGEPTKVVMGFAYWLGLLLLMFVSGCKVQGVLARRNRAATAWLVTVGTTLPFAISLAVGSIVSLKSLTGPANNHTAVLLVLGVSVAVTSIPVISRIFHDLGILHTRFASLVLGVAIIEDIALWAVLAMATALAAGGALGVADHVALHIAATVGYMVVGLVAAPRLIRRLHAARWNVLVTGSPVGYPVMILLVYGSIAALMDVNLAFAAFLAGFGLVGGVSGASRDRFAAPLDAIAKVSFAVFIPVYFAVVGAQLQLGKSFSIGLLAVFLVGSSILSMASRVLASRLARFRGLDLANIAAACNARGGPGIVAASVAFQAGIISPRFFTALVLTAILTSQAAALWLGSVVRRGLPLLAEEGPVSLATQETPAESVQAAS